MSIAEQNLTRDFCYKCSTKVTGIVKLHCPKCGNTDLIPTPSNPGLASSILDGQSFTGFASDSGQVSSQIPNVSNISKLEIDPEIIKRIMDSEFIFVTGLAGTGKSTLLREINRLHPSFMELCSTTGIAAINLGGKTINSALKYFDTKSLRQRWESKFLQMHLRAIRSRAKMLVIEEVSMMDAEALDYIVDAVDDINGDLSNKKLGIILIGDLCQLSPIKAPWVFKSKFWDRFEKNTLKLTKVWRQDNPEFVNAINLVRKGDGNNAVIALIDCGVQFTSALNPEFDGTTIIPKNDEVDIYNQKRLAQIDSPLVRLYPTRRGKQLNEWERGIPYELRLKIGAYVMILSNDYPSFNYVNGDCGILEEYDSMKETAVIRLKRTGNVVNVRPVTRKNLSDNDPAQSDFSSMFTPKIDPITNQWILGTIEYVPLRLAYASTVHKSQGLSLDKVQIDSRNTFFGFDNMAYVAISRCRTPEGLTIIGQPAHVANKIRVAKEVKKYI